MNKMLSGFLLAGLLGSSLLADVLRVEGGVGIWGQEVSGPITNSGIIYESDQLGFDSESQVYAWAFFKHPIPIIPNVRFEYSEVDFTGTADVTISGSTRNAASEVGLSQFDTILYYNVLDNTLWTTIDLGVDLKYVDAVINITDTGTQTAAVDEAEKFVLPMLYARGRVEIPGTGIGIEALAKYIEYKDTSMSDAEIKIDYTLVDILPVDVGLELGYRVQNLDMTGDDFDLTTDADVKVDGVFAGAVVRF